MSARRRNTKPKTPFLTSQEEATPEEIAKVKAFLNRAADTLYGEGAQLSASDVAKIAEQSVTNLHKRPPGHR